MKKSEAIEQKIMALQLGLVLAQKAVNQKLRKHGKRKTGKTDTRRTNGRHSPVPGINRLYNGCDYFDMCVNGKGDC